MENKKRKGRIAAWLLVAVMLLSLVPVSGMQVQAAGSNEASTQAAQEVTAVFGNNGYPYGKAMSNSSVTLVADLADGVSAGSVQWQSANAKDGQYSDISGATGLEYTLNPTENTWYRCVVNNVESHAVKIITYSGSFYITNETMAYTVKSDGNQYSLFNVVGYYNNDWAKTSFSNQGWEMMTDTNASPEKKQYTYSQSVNAYLDKLRISFDEKNAAQLSFEVDLAEDQQAFSFGSDVQIGSNDSAPLNAVYNQNGTVKQVQMVSAASLKQATASDLAMVLNYTTAPSRYWLGRYGSRCYYDYARDTNQKIVSKVEGIDSGMTTSWTKLAAGSTVKFNFSVGSVEETGADINTETDVTSKRIIYTGLKPDYFYKLETSDDGETWKDVENATWVTPDNETLVYGDESIEGTKEGTRVNIKENTYYRLVYKKSDSGSTDKVNGGDVMTNVDPTTPGGDAGSEADNKIVEKIEWNRITLSNVRADYSYQLLDEHGNPLVEDEWKTADPNDETRTIVFEGLNESTKYYLVARTPENARSDQHEIVTVEHPRMDLTYDANLAEETVNNMPENVTAGVPWKKEYTLSTATPEKETADTYQFVGWSENPDAAEPEYQPGDKVTFEKDTTLYAIWKMPLTYTAEDVTVAYDGQPHTVKVDVTVPETGATITYGTSKDAITSEEPAYTDAGTYPIWYQIAADNYKVERGQKTLTITKATPTLTLKNKTYLEEGQGSIDEATVTGVNDEELSKDNITYTYYTDKDCTVKTTSANGATSDGTAPTKKGTYYVKAVRSEDKNYKDAESNVAKIVIAPDVYFLDEDGNKHYCSFEEAFDPEINTQKETVYVAGNTIVDADVTVPEDFALEISGGATLTISDGVTFTNKGTIFNDKDAVIGGEGTFVNEGTMTNGTVNAVVINKGILDHPTLNNTVTNEGTIKAMTSGSGKITNEGDGKVITSSDKVVTRSITFDAGNKLTSDVADQIENPAKKNVPCGNKLSGVELPQLDDIENVAEFEGWYLDPECTKPAKTSEEGVSVNLALYANWVEFSAYEAYWTDNEGKKHYGSLEKVLEEIKAPEYSETVKELHVQKEVTLNESTDIPENVKLVVDEKGTLKLEEGVKLTVPAGIENNGTIAPVNEGSENKPGIEAPITNKNSGTLKDIQVTGDVTNAEGATIKNAAITGEVTNAGKIEKTEITGNVTNNGTMTDDNVTGNLINNKEVTGGEVTGNVTNNESGKIQNTTIDDEKFDNNGTYTSKADGDETETTVTYTVDFFVNGEKSTILSQSVKRAAKATKPERPEVEEGKVFSGWYADAACKTLWKFNTNKITKNTTIYAKTGSADQFETYWKDEEDNDTYGSLKNAIDSGSKEIQIINDCKVSEDMETVEGAVITVDPDATVTIVTGKSFTVNGTVQNNGTMKNNGTLKVTEAVQNDGTVQNNGTVKVNGTITNNGSIQQKTAATMEGAKLDNKNSISGGTFIFDEIENAAKATISNATIDGTVTNNGKIDDSTLNKDVTNNGTISGGTIGENATVHNNKKIENTDIQGEVINGENGKVNDEDDNQKTFTVTYDSNGHTQTVDPVTVNAGEKIKDEPILDNDTEDVFTGWYTAKEGTTKWNFATGTVSKNITLYAHWTPKADYEARWTDASGKEVFGTLEEAIEAGGKDIYIQKSITITKDTKLPEGVTVTVEKNATVTITGDGRFDVSSGKLVNEGTIQTEDATATPQIFGNVENAAGAAIENTAIAGDVNNRKDGQITGGKIEGTVNNAGEIKSAEVTGNVTNEGTITDSDVKADSVTNKQGGVITGGTIAGTTEEKQPEIKNEAGAKISGTEINGAVTNAGTIENGTISGTIENEQDGQITGGKLEGTVTNAGNITKAEITGEITNAGTITEGSVTAGKDTTIKNEPGAIISDATLEGMVENQGTLTDNNVDAADVENKGDGKITDSAEEDTKLRKTVTFDVQGIGTAPEEQKVEYGALAKGVQVDAVDGKVVAGWYTDSACTDANRWNFLKNIVKKNMTLYAKWAAPTDFEAVWAENGATIYGTLEDALASGSKDITIQKSVELSDKVAVSEDVKVTIKKGVTVTIPENATVMINGTLENNGTISNNGTLQADGQVTNNGTLNNNESGVVSGKGNLTNQKTIYGGTIDTTVENSGKIDGAVVNGNVTNKSGGNISDSTMSGEVTNETGANISNSTMSGNVTNETGANISNCTMSGQVTNKEGATIERGKLEKSSHVTNEGTINNTEVKGSVENGESGKIVGSDLENVVYKVTFDTLGHGTKAPAVQNVVCGRKVTEPAHVRDTQFVFVAWYKDKECKQPWNFAKDTVNANITLYAQWNPTSAYDTYWTNADGERDYGTLEEAIAAGGKNIHIQKDVAITKDTKLPEGVTVTIDKDVTVTISGNGKLEVSGKLHNEGSIQTDAAKTTPQIVGNVENAAGAAIRNTVIAGGVDNRKDGQITGGKIEGTVNNAGEIKSAEVTGNVTNEGTITDSDVKADSVTNKQGGVIAGGRIAGTTEEKQPEIKNEAGAKIGGTEINGNVDNAGTLGSEDTNTRITGSLTNTGNVAKAEVSGTTTNAGTISSSRLEGETTNRGTIDQSTIEGKLTNEKDGKITAGTVTGETTNNGKITAGTVAGKTTNNGTISGSAVEGTVTNNGGLEGITKAPDATIDNKNPDATMKDTDGKEITVKVTFDANGHGTAPEAQNIAYGKYATKPADIQDEEYTMRGWYQDAEGKTPWNFEEDTVTDDVTIYAKWTKKAEFEVTWKTEDGQDAFGTLEEAIAAGGKDIHIQKDLTIGQDVTIPEGTTVTVDTDITVTIPAGVTVTVSEKAAFVNDGTVKNQSKITGTGTVTNNGTLQGSTDSAVDTTVVNNGRIHDSELNGTLENNGVVKDTTLNGNVTNNNKINDSQINAGLKNNGKVTTDGDEVIYKDQTVKGDITKGDDKANVTDTTITFQQGNDKQPEQKVTDGKYTVAGLKDGYYNVVIPSEDGKVNTFFVKVENDEIQMKEFNLPEGNLSNEVIVEEGTPNIVVGGLEEMLVPSGAASKDTAGVTAEDQNTAKEGGDVDVTFIAKQLKTTTDEAAQIEQKMKEDGKDAGLNLDLSVLKTVTKVKGDSSTTTETKLTELDQAVMVRIPLDESKQGKKNYVVYRSHTNQDGRTSIDCITEKKNSDGEYIEIAEDGTVVILHTKKFSTYVLGYDSERKEEPTTEEPTTEEPTTEEPTTEKPTTEEPTTETPAVNPTDGFTQEQKQAVDTLMTSLGLTEEEAAQMVLFAQQNGVSVKTMSITGKAIMARKNDKDVDGSDFAKLRARSDKLTSTSIKLKWTKVTGADGYYIYGNKCGKKNQYKLIKEITKGNKVSYTQKKLSKGTYYKYIVIAYKKIGDKKITIAASKTIHATTTGGKYGVAKAVKVNKKTINLKKKKTVTIKASEVKRDKRIKRHRKIAFESSNSKIATVNSNGVVKGIKKGTCYIYVYAQNGVYQKIKVKVK